MRFVFAIAIRLIPALIVYVALQNPTILSSEAVQGTIRNAQDRPALSVPNTPPSQLHPIVGHAIHGDVSAALRDLEPVTASPPMATIPLVRRSRGMPPQSTSNNGAAIDSLARHTPASAATLMPSPVITFEGINNRNGFVPADPNGDVGPNHYVQTVNMQIAVYSKTTGALLYGPVNLNTLWSGFPGSCQFTNDGDPIVIYDPLADRWLISQFSIPSNTGPFLQCVAVSTTPDPTGSYYRYAFQMPAVPGYPNGKFNDYTKLAVWPDAYYMTVNQFGDATASAPFVGAGVFALDRAHMLAGVANPLLVYIDLGPVDMRFGNMLPADVDGRIPPPIGAPGYFAEVDSSTVITPDDAMRIWQFHVDWSDPTSATFGLAGQPDAILPVAPFNYLPCVPNSLQCIPQPGVTSISYLDAVGDRLMHRLAYRNFGDHESLLANHTVDVGSGVAGVRWYEVRDLGGTPFMYQQGTHTLDSTSRWMGSIAMDQDGNAALGYSASSNTVFPSIRYAGRLAADPLGTLAQGEVSLIAGKGSQTTFLERWGDYSSMSIDPSDDCTFWYTNEYYASTSDHSWQTRIGAFRFPSCGPGTLTGVISDAVTTLPISGALVIASPGSTVFSATTNVDGVYTLLIPGGTFTLTASAYGYQSGFGGSVTVSSSATLTHDMSLTPAPTITLSGVVTDIASGAPLTAVVRINGSPLQPPSAFTGTAPNGTYTLTVVSGQTYTLTASAPFHTSQTRPLGLLTSDQVQNFALWREILLIMVMKP